MSTPASVFDTIRQRRSVFPAMYSDTPITTDEIETLLEAARWAPTHRKTQPWRFVVMHSLESRQQLSDYMGDRYLAIAGANVVPRKEKKIRQKPLQAGAVLAIVMQRDASGSVPEWEEIAATSMAIQNMWLLAHTMGIGAYWSTPETITDGAQDFLRLQTGQCCLGLFYMGRWSSVDLPSERMAVEEFVEWR